MLAFSVLAEWHGISRLIVGPNEFFSRICCVSTSKLTFSIEKIDSVLSEARSKNVFTQYEKKKIEKLFDSIRLSIV